MRKALVFTLSKIAAFSFVVLVATIPAPADARVAIGIGIGGCCGYYPGYYGGTIPIITIMHRLLLSMLRLPHHRR